YWASVRSNVKTISANRSPTRLPVSWPVVRWASSLVGVESVAAAQSVASARREDVVLQVWLPAAPEQCRAALDCPCPDNARRHRESACPSHSDNSPDHCWRGQDRHHKARTRLFAGREIKMIA